jgi:hypothetical protein
MREDEPEFYANTLTFQIRASLDFGVCEGPGTHPQWIPRGNSAEKDKGHLVGRAGLPHNLDQLRGRHTGPKPAAYWFLHKSHVLAFLGSGTGKGLAG